MARERQLEGAHHEGAETHFSDVELDENGDPIEEEEEEEGDEGGDDGDDGEEDRGDIVDEDDPLAEPGGDETDIAALSAVAGNRTIPKARFDQVLADNRRLQGLVEQIAAGRVAPPARAEETTQQPQFDLKAKLKERADAILEGDTDRIVALDEEIETHRNTVVRQQGEEAGRTAAIAAVENNRVTAIVNAAFERYPFLDSNNADFNEEALGDVMMYRDRYMAEGQARSDALRKAINKVCPHYVDDDAGGGEGADAGGRPNGSAAGGKPRKAGDPNARKPATVIRNAKAGSRLPPRLSGAGTGGAAARRNTGERAASDIPSGEYADLPEAERARLRGDFVTE